MNIIFFHIATIGEYQVIVDEIFDNIISSKLIDNVNAVNLSILGNNILNLPKNKKIKIIFENKDISLGEFPILNYIKEFSKNNNCNILYLHTKGVTNNNKPIQDWRKYMLYFNVEKYEECLEILKEYDTCGVDLVNEPVKHYSGNFWWGKSEYLKTLPDFKDMNIILTERHKCEFWICYNKGIHYNMWNSNINVYERHLCEYNEKNYKL